MPTRSSSPRTRLPSAAATEPMPACVRPMLATTAPLPTGPEVWQVEMKWDGVRAVGYAAPGRPLRLLSRNDRDITVSYPEVAELRSDVPLVLDGELVALDDAGRPSFEALQQRMHVGSSGQAARLSADRPVTYLVFDVLHLDGRSTRDLPLSERRRLLEGLGLAGPAWQVPPVFTGDGAHAAEVLEASRRQHLEGVLCKRLSSSYTPGRRSGDWTKHKNVRRQEVVIGGWKPGEGGRAGQIGSLLVGVQGPTGLEYAGHVGTGFSQEVLRRLGALLAPLERPQPAFGTPVPREHARSAHWVEPELVCDVEFTEWTREGRLRHPSYKGLRDDKDPGDVVREPS